MENKHATINAILIIVLMTAFQIANSVVSEKRHRELIGIVDRITRTATARQLPLNPDLEATLEAVREFGECQSLPTGANIPAAVICDPADLGFAAGKPVLITVTKQEPTPEVIAFAASHVYCPNNLQQYRWVTKLNVSDTFDSAGTVVAKYDQCTAKWIPVKEKP